MPWPPASRETSPVSHVTIEDAPRPPLRLPQVHSALNVDGKLPVYPQTPNVHKTEMNLLLQKIAENLEREHLVAARRHEETMRYFREQQSILKHQSAVMQDAARGYTHSPTKSNGIYGSSPSTSPIRKSIGTNGSAGFDIFISDNSLVGKEAATWEKANMPDMDMDPAAPCKVISERILDSSKVTETLSRKSNLRIHGKSRSLNSDEINKIHNKWLARAGRIVKDDRFEVFVAGMILANAIMLCVEVQYYGLDLGYDLQFAGCTQDGDGTWPAGKALLASSDWMFGILFFLEASVKIATHCRAYFLDWWSWLDLLCVAAFVFDKTASAISPVDGKALRLIRLCRLMRLTRLFRTMEEFDALFVMTTTIKGMAQILFWAVGLLSVMLMACALFLCQVLHASYFNNVSASRMSEDELQAQHQLYEFFGTFTRCFFSMFELTLANWPTVARALGEEVSEWFMFLCVVHKLTIGFAVIGVINGVILQETFKVASIDDMIMYRQKQRATFIMKEKMVALFAALDLDNDGKIDLDEFYLIADIPEVKTWLASMDVETDDLPTLFMLIDVDRSGTITVDELISRVPRIKGTARGMDVMALRSRVNQLTAICSQAQVGSPNEQRPSWNNGN